MVRLIPFLALLASTGAPAQPTACDALAGEEKALSEKLTAKLKGYDCCEQTLDACLAQKSPCPLAKRLRERVCRMVQLGQGAEAIETAFAKRKESMTGARATFALDEAAALGDPKAPVGVVVYACTRCPFCRNLLLDLYREVTEDRLKGKVRLWLRPFPLKGHEGATEGAMALVAAARLGRFWPMALYEYKHFDEFSPDVLPDWAQFAGMDRAQFEKAVADPATRDALAECKKEGVRNKVAATPTVYVDGRLWTGEPDLDSLVDAILEVAERPVAAR